MSIFFTLLYKIIPLYFGIILGFFSTFFLHCNRDSVAKILLYILSPLVVFNSALSLEFSSSVLALPIFIYLLSSFIAFVSLPIFKKIFSDNTANLLSFSVATGNSANLGIPIAIVLLDDRLVEIFIFTTVGTMLYQNTIGYFITAKGNLSAKESFKKVLKLPVIYAFIFGLVLNLIGVKMPLMFYDFFSYLKGTLAILGMLIVGMGMEKVVNKNGFDVKFISIALFVKFIIWPSLVSVFIIIDNIFLHIFTKDLYIILFILSIVPLAGNTVTISTLLNVKPEKMSLAVFITTLISLFSIPMMIYFYQILSVNL